MQRVPVMKMVNHIEYIRCCKHKEFSLWMIRVKQTRGKPIQEGIRRQQSIGAGLLCSNFFCIELSSLISIIMIGPFSFPISHLSKDFRAWIGYHCYYSGCSNYYFIFVVPNIYFNSLLNKSLPISSVSGPISASQIPSVWWRGEKWQVEQL